MSTQKAWQEFARWSVPIGANQAMLIISGREEPTPEDFDSLVEFVEFVRRQFQRREATIPGLITKAELDQRNAQIPKIDPPTPGVGGGTR